MLEGDRNLEPLVQQEILNGQGPRGNDIDLTLIGEDNMSIERNYRRMFLNAILLAFGNGRIQDRAGFNAYSNNIINFPALA